jgi:hypothetical protein
MMMYSSPSSLISCPEYFAEQNRVPRLDLQRYSLAIVVGLAIASSDHLPLLRLFLGAVGDDDSADLLFAFVEALDEDAVVQRSDIHDFYSRLTDVTECGAQDFLSYPLSGGPGTGAVSRKG